MKIQPLVISIGCIVLAFAGYLAIFGAREAAKPSVGAPLKLAASAIDRSAAKQAKRIDSINSLKAAGFLSHVDLDHPGAVHVFVRQSFIDSDFQDKVDVVSMIYGYYFEGYTASDTVYLFDARSGKSVGRFVPSSGLRMD